MSVELPALTELRVVDLGSGMCAALIAKQFAEFGASVCRVEQVGGDPFNEFYPAYRHWRRNVDVIDPEDVEQRLSAADVCIVGGEDFPGLPAAPDAAEISTRNPRLIVIDINGYSGSAKHRPAVDLLVQARTGAAFEQFSEKPVAAGFPIANYGAALQAQVGAWAALIERERSDKGQVVTISLAAGAAMFWAPFWMEAERPDPAFAGITPRDVRHLTLRCKDGDYVQLAMAVPGAKAKIYDILGIDEAVDSADRGMPDAQRGPEGFYGDVALLERYSRQFHRDDLLAALRSESVPAEAVRYPGECWDDGQTRITGILQTDAEGWQGVGSAIRISLGKTNLTTQNRSSPSPSGTAPPLAGIRIIDCGIFVAGPYASKLLADLGADVIRIEPTNGRSTLSGERTIISANHGKRSISIDLKTPEGHALALSLCKTADIVAHNFRVGVAQRLGLDRDSLLQVNPGLITLETTAYGTHGPMAAAPGFDMIMQARCGMQRRSGGRERPPQCTRAPMIDFASGAHGAIGLLGALFERMRSGTTCAVNTSLADAGMHMMSELVRSPDGVFHGAPLLNEAQTGFRTSEAIYSTQDGWVAIAIRSQAMADAFTGALDLHLAPLQHWGPEEAIKIAASMWRHQTASLMATLDMVDVWAEPCQFDGWRDQDRSGVPTWVIQETPYGKVRHKIGPLVEFSRSVLTATSRLSVEPGEDTFSILNELGLPEEALSALLDDGIILGKKVVTATPG